MCTPYLSHDKNRNLDNLYGFNYIFYYDTGILAVHHTSGSQMFYFQMCSNGTKIQPNYLVPICTHSIQVLFLILLSSQFHVCVKNEFRQNVHHMARMVMSPDSLPHVDHYMVLILSTKTITKNVRRLLFVTDEN